MAATTCLQSEQEGSDEEDEEDSPTHCALYKEKKCKYQDRAFKPPKTTLWIGCSYPGCNEWYHEQCLSLQFEGDKEREYYMLICPQHKNIKEHFCNKVIALSTEFNSLSDENISLQAMPKRLRLNKKSNSQQQIDYSIHPNYVEYEGQYYHTAEFLSLQEGKVYHPATSRLARWIESARNDFYKQVEKLIAPQRVETGTYLNDIVALWLPSEGLHVGLVIRIVRSPSLKSNFHVFEWRSDSQKSERATICFRVLNFLKKDSHTWELEATKTFWWCHVRSLLKVVGRVSVMQQTWPVNVDLSNVVKDLPRLQLMDKEREK